MLPGTDHPRDRPDSVAGGRRDNILTVVSHLAELLLGGQASWSEVLQDALASVGRAAGADRAGVLEVSEDAEGRGAVSRPYAWSAQGIDDLAPDARLEGLLYEDAGYGPWAEALASGETLSIDTEELDGQQRELLDAFGIRTMLFSPIHVDGVWWGAISLERVRSGDGWSTIEMDALVTAGRALGAAITHDRLREERDAHAAELARSNRDLEHFAYVASHDLQEPLRMVTSFVQLLERRYGEQLDDQAREYIGYAVDGATRMQQLINDLLAYSRVGSRGTPFAPVDLSEIVGAGLRDLRGALDAAGAEVVVGTLPVVVGDPTQLGQLFTNLVGNAVKFNEGGTPTIRIEAEPAGEHWSFTVADDGIGIAPEHADRVFTLFQRLHTREEHPGTGMGLAICRRIVERHGGRIWVEPNEPRGSVFRFTLPAEDQPS